MRLFSVHRYFQGKNNFKSQFYFSVFSSVFSTHINTVDAGEDAIRKVKEERQYGGGE